MKRYWMFSAMLFGACTTQDGLGTVASESGNLGNNHPIPNELGASTTWSTAGGVDFGNEFFQEFGTNQRTCGSCHKASEGWTVSATRVRELFDSTGGLDPLFRTNDGSNSPSAPVATVEQRRAAYSMMLARGTIRVGIGIPAGAEFELIAVDDPYGHASAAELSLFRRPLPSANLTLIPQVMWDGRVPGATPNDRLKFQANDATLGHAVALQPLTEAERQAIVDFEVGLFNAQLVAKDIGRLDVEGAQGGAEALATQAFVAGRFDLFDGWANSTSETRRAVFRGQELFNTKPRSNGGGACRGCHSTENSGTNRNGIFFDIGTSAGSRRAADQPLYTLRRISTGETITTTDPGRALITGLWNDLNRFKTPSLRALGARSPYFHGGSADTLEEVVAFYEESLLFDFSPQEEADLVAFLSAL